MRFDSVSDHDHFPVGIECFFIAFCEFSCVVVVVVVVLLFSAIKKHFSVIDIFEYMSINVTLNEVRKQAEQNMGNLFKY